VKNNLQGILHYSACRDYDRDLRNSERVLLSGDLFCNWRVSFNRFFITHFCLRFIRIVKFVYYVALKKQTKINWNLNLLKV
jgi:hypothetical protein